MNASRNIGLSATLSARALKVAGTLALWVGPALFVLIAAMSFGQYLRRRSSDRTTQAHGPLTATEQKRIDELLGERNST